MFSPLKVMQLGKPLDIDKYEWDRDNLIFISEENNLMLDFSYYNYLTFKTGHDCIIRAGNNCAFQTGNSCHFISGSDCSFETGHYCTFKTDNRCVFYTGSTCIFSTNGNCNFTTRENCTFLTNHSCIFKTGDNCFVSRYDVEGVIEIPVGKTIKLNDWEVAGYTIVKEPKRLNRIVEKSKIVKRNGKKYKRVEIN